jgi:hypothetical protein
MITTEKRNIPRRITRLKEVWQELDYAQRRALELRMGLSFDTDPDAASQAEIQELESLYELPAHDVSPALGERPSANAR